MPHPDAAPPIVETKTATVSLVTLLSGTGHSSVAEELSLLQGAATSAVMMLQFFRDRLSKDPKADLKAAFNHIDNALAHGQCLLEEVDVANHGDLDLLFQSRKSLQSILSDVPQISFMNNWMIDSFHETKDLVAKIERVLKFSQVLIDTSVQ